MQPQEPFASLGLSAATTPTSPSTRRLPSAQLPTSAASVSFQTNGSKTIPQLIASEASHSSGMSSSVASANTDASSVVSQQNPFDNVVVPTTGSGGYGASPQVVSSLSYNSQITDSSSFATGAGLAVNPHLRLPPATPPSAHAISGSPTHLTTPVQLPVSLSVPSSPSYEHQYQQQQHTDMMFDDDENTAPSSAANTEEQTNTISRFVENTKRRINQRRDSADEAHMDGALIAGYLQKLGRNGKWQTRWFETDGECLSYYKSSKRSKLLATLDLEKVQKIVT